MSKLAAVHHPPTDDLGSDCRASLICVAVLVPCVIGCQIVDLAVVRSAVSVTSDREHRAPADVPAEHSASIAVDDRSAEPVSSDEVGSDVTVDGIEQLDSDALSIPEGPLKLTLNAALHFALENNRQIRVLSLVPDEVATALPVEEAQFDPTLSTGGQWNAVNQQVESAIQAFGTGINTYRGSSFSSTGGLGDQLQIEKQWQTGTRARLGYSTNYNNSQSAGQFLVVNPAWNSRINLGVEQSLWNGFGKRQNQMGLRMAQWEFDGSIQDFRTEVNRILFDVATVYWQYDLERSQQSSLEETVAQAEMIWRREQKRLDTGMASAVEVFQSQENLESLQADLTQARQRCDAAARALRQRLGISPHDTRELIVGDAPSQRPFTANLQAGLESALQSRPELMAQRIRVRQSQLELERAKDGLLPNVVASANYALTGLGNGMMGSFDQLASVGYGNWGLGVSYRLPVGRRAERSMVQRAEIAHRRNQQTLSELQRDIEFEVQQIHQTIQHAFQVMQRQNNRLMAATQQFQTSRRMYETGQMDLDRYVRAQQSLVVAKREQRESIIEYNLAISKWYFLTNTLTLSESNTSPPAQSSPAQSSPEQSSPEQSLDSASRADGRGGSPQLRRLGP